jgi:hypothetical protein
MLSGTDVRSGRLTIGVKGYRWAELCFLIKATIVTLMSPSADSYDIIFVCGISLEPESSPAARPPS